MADLLLEDYELSLCSEEEDVDFFDNFNESVENIDEEGTITFQQFEQRIIQREKEVEEARRDCAICLDEIVERGIIDSCSHSFCYDCIRQWGRKQKTCPCCKRSFRRVRKAKKTPKKCVSAKQCGETAVSILVDDPCDHHKKVLTAAHDLSEWTPSTKNKKSKKKNCRKKNDKAKKAHRKTTSKSCQKSQKPTDTSNEENATSGRHKLPSQSERKRKNANKECMKASPLPQREGTKGGVVWVKNSLTGRWVRGRRGAIPLVDLSSEKNVDSAPTQTALRKSASRNTHSTPNTLSPKQSNIVSAFSDVKKSLESCDDNISAMRNMMQRLKNQRLVNTKSNE